MDFEWNDAKSADNFVKHGVSFEEAMVIWTGRTLEMAEIARSKDGERRGATIGLIGSEAYTAIWTFRGRTLRIISVRRARHGEAKAYWEKIAEES